jgi:DNA-directed RNA polymerase specialized sigma24 family protein
MNAILKSEPAEPFEEVLLAYVDMCYSVALALTRDAYDARELTQDVMTWAWYFRDTENGTADIKMKLLRALREKSLQRHASLHVRSPAASNRSSRTQAGASSNL